MPFYTKFGDKGKTTLLGSTTVPKNHPRVEAYGSVDELNAVLGIVISFNSISDIDEELKQIQKDLFVIGAELASKETQTKKISPMRIEDLEKKIDWFEKELPPLKNFVLPGGSKTASLLHLARTICRRTERTVVDLSEKEKINESAIKNTLIEWFILFLH